MTEQLPERGHQPRYHVGHNAVGSPPRSEDVECFLQWHRAAFRLSSLMRDSADAGSNASWQVERLLADDPPVEHSDFKAIVETSHGEVAYWLMRVTCNDKNSQ